jgi:uncharacterized membrane protein YhaH (DUF805 family)
MAINEIVEKLNNANAEMHEEIIYAEVFAEIQAGFRKEGLWAKALSECEGDEKKTEALYIKYRAKSLDGELKKYTKEKYKKNEENKKEEEGNKNFFNSASRTRFWVTFFFFLGLVHQAMTYEVSIAYQQTSGMVFTWFIIIINIITWVARAKDAGINVLWVLGMFIPFINFISVYFLGFTPTESLKDKLRKEEEQKEKDGKEKSIDKLSLAENEQGAFGAYLYNKEKNEGGAKKEQRKEAKRKIDKEIGGWGK